MLKTTLSTDRRFKEDFGIELEPVVKWIANNLSPELVFGDRDWFGWAVVNGLIRVDEYRRTHTECDALLQELKHTFHKFESRYAKLPDVLKK
ncbi:MAG: hypothetical protein ABFE02_04635 [Sulfuricella sp.]